MKKYKMPKLILTCCLLSIFSLCQAQTKNTNLVVDIPFEDDEIISDLKATDLNNDGTDEIIAITAPGMNLYAFRWYEDHFENIWMISQGDSYAWGMQVTDFDNDGKNDLLVSFDLWGCEQNLSFYKNYGDIFINQGSLIQGCPHEIFCTYDLDGDSLIDLATGSAFGNSGFSVQLYKHDSNNQTVTYMGLLPNAENGANMVTALNMNNDDKMDILAAEKSSGSLYTYQNNGEFDFTQTFFYQFDYIKSIETGDFDNDGWEDFIVSISEGIIHFFRNLGNGNFDIGFSTDTLDSWIVETVAVDIDKDDKTDLVVAAHDGNIYLFKNVGNFNFEEMIYQNSDTICYDLTYGDFDGNGEVDLVFGRNPAYVVFDAINYFVPVSVHEKHFRKNEGLSISQNVPNPFEDFTTIEFELNHCKTGELVVFDQTGKSILSTTIHPSSRKIKISGSKLKPGIYFYQLKTSNGISETRKMINL